MFNRGHQLFWWPGQRFFERTVAAPRGGCGKRGGRAINYGSENNRLTRENFHSRPAGIAARRRGRKTIAETIHALLRGYGCPPGPRVQVTGDKTGGAPA